MTDPTPVAHDPVDEALAHGPYLADDGFTARVLKELPRPRRTVGRYLVPLFALAGVSLGVALLVGPGATLPPSFSSWLLSGPGALGSLPAAVLGAGLAFLATGVLVAFAD
jgi:hypothetical protein